MNEDSIKTFIENHTCFDVSDVFDPMIERRLVWKLRRYREYRGKIELMEICGNKCRVSAHILYDFTEKKPKISVWKENKLILNLRFPRDIIAIAKGLESTSLAQYSDFGRKNVRTSIRRVLMIYDQKKVKENGIGI